MEQFRKIKAPNGTALTVSSEGRIFDENDVELNVLRCTRKSGKGKGCKIPAQVYVKAKVGHGKFYNAARLIASGFLENFPYEQQAGFNDGDCHNIKSDNLYDPRKIKVNDLKGEIWRDFPIEGFSDYKVSNMGRVKRHVERYIQNRYRGQSLVKPFTRHGGYLSIAVYKDNGGGVSMFLLHRIVAMAFIPNPDNLEQVNHIDEDKLNNFVKLTESGEYCGGNLEWCTCDYNLRYGTRVQRVSYSNSHHLKAVSNSGEVVYFDSLEDAKRKIGISPITTNKRIKDGQYWKGYKWYRV